MKARALENLGIPHTLTKLAKWLASDVRTAGLDQHQVRDQLKAIVADPAAFLDDLHFAQLAHGLAKHQTITTNSEQGFEPRQTPAPWQQWGTNLDEQSVAQMRNAAQLPVAVTGALMPDAHLGYSLPIGGVLATENAVVPYAVGVDIWNCQRKRSPVKRMNAQAKGDHRNGRDRVSRQWGLLMREADKDADGGTLRTDSTQAFH